MDSSTLIAVISIATAGITIGIGWHVPGARRGPFRSHRIDLAGTAT